MHQLDAQLKVQTSYVIVEWCFFSSIAQAFSHASSSFSPLTSIFSHPSLLSFTQSTASSICLFSAVDTAGQSDKDKQDTEFCGSLTACVHTLGFERVCWRIHAQSQVFNQFTSSLFPFWWSLHRQGYMLQYVSCFQSPVIHFVIIVFIILINRLHIIFHQPIRCF